MILTDCRGRGKDHIPHVKIQPTNEIQWLGSLRMPTLERSSRYIHLTWGLILFTLLAGSAEAKGKPSTLANHSLRLNQQSLLKEKELQEEAKKYRGIRYRRGGSSRKGMDCSGFVRVVYRNVFGIDLPHNASSLYPLPIFENAPLGGLRTGDLVFFRSGQKKRITHVGIYLSGGDFIHAARTSGVTVSSLNSAYWKKRIVGAKRLADPELWKDETEEGVGVLAQNRALFPECHSLFSFQFASTDIVEPALPFPSGLFPDQPWDRLTHLEFAMDAPLLDDASWDLNFLAFRDSYSLSGGDLDSTRVLFEPSLDGLADRFYRQGIRIASDIHPSRQIRISPSITYFDHGESTYGFNLSKRAVGLEFELTSRSEGWSLSSALQYGTKSRLAIGGGESLEEWNGLDLALAYRQRLSKNTQFVLLGSSIQRFVPSLENDEPIDQIKDEHRFTILFNFTY